jgi:hypothetical protein
VGDHESPIVVGPFVGADVVVVGVYVGALVVTEGE